LWSDIGFGITRQPSKLKFVRVEAKGNTFS
jgi:hypothetical protein